MSKNKQLLTEQDIIQILKEEWNKKILFAESLTKELDASSGKEGNKKPDLMSPGLKLRHSKTGLLYTITSISKDGVSLTTPEGKEIFVKLKELETNYELD